MDAEVNNTGMLNVLPVNELMESMSSIPAPDALYNTLWYEGEIACLFADSNVGKSIFAVQMAVAIAATRPVMYVDCELTDKQFQVRYSNQERRVHYVFPDFFFRATIVPERIGSGNFEESLLRDIENEASRNSCSVIIIDNLTYVCNTSEKGDAAGMFMMKLKKLQMLHGWSILMIAHTPKRDDGGVITINHLAGSRKLFNFFDSVFALGKSKQDGNIRYLKQLKSRSGEIEYSEENVAIFELEKLDDGYLRFLLRGSGSEKALLGYNRGQGFDMVRRVVALKQLGRSFREIAETLGISKSTAQRIYRNACDQRSQLLEAQESLYDDEDEE